MYAGERNFFTPIDTNLFLGDYQIVTARRSMPSWMPKDVFISRYVTWTILHYHTLPADYSFVSGSYAQSHDSSPVTIL